jgi:protein involved in polysaccharide export with SLBB domain
MKRLFLTILFMVVTININAQDAKPSEIKVGDLLEIGRYDAPAYKHIDFPRANFIIKKGGIANYKSVEGNKVVITSVKEKKNGALQVKIKRADGRKFFNSHSVVSADLNSALESGELSTL